MISLKANNIEPTPLDEAIDRLFTSLQKMHPASDEYSKTADQLLKLYKLRDESNAKKRVSPDALVQVAGSLAGILAILSYERVAIITTKAMPFVMKAIR